MKWDEVWLVIVLSFVFGAAFAILMSPWVFQ